jgi:hypothetical protein
MAAAAPVSLTRRLTLMKTRQEIRDDVPLDPDWWDRWSAEAHRRYERLASGEDAGLSAEEFWSDADAPLQLTARSARRN